MERWLGERKPVLIEVGIDGGDCGVLDVGRSGEIREAFGEVDSVATLGKKRQLLNWRGF